MRPPMKLGKQVEDSLSTHCLDRISSLPDDLLGHILSFLPTRCAVSTSILSTRWRYLFTLTTCLSFDDAPCFGHLVENERIEATRKFKEFVDKVLELHRVSPIEKFSLLCGSTYDNLDLNRWISTALQKGVQELYYKLADQIGRVSDSVFRCETLVSLKLIDLGFNKIEIPPLLPKLKILHLERIVFFDFSSVEKLLSGCHLLEDLTLKSCECETDGHAIHRSGILKVLTIERCSTFEIDAPNLAYLICNSNIGVIIVPSWKDLPSFVKVELTFNCIEYDDTDEDSVEYDHELLKAAAYKTTKLCFEMDSAKVLLTLYDGEQMPDFPSLSRLHVQNCPYDAWTYVTDLLDKSP